ncbi:hypothetical protein JW835_12785 [bacterium]|nr:hypothetical protein [bacterium]
MDGLDEEGSRIVHVIWSDTKVSARSVSFAGILNRHFKLLVGIHFE